MNGSDAGQHVTVVSLGDKDKSHTNKAYVEDNHAEKGGTNSVYVTNNGYSGYVDYRGEDYTNYKSGNYDGIDTDAGKHTQNGSAKTTDDYPEPGDPDGYVPSKSGLTYRYASTIVNYPFHVIGIVGVIVVVMAVLSLTLVDLPDLSEPMASLQARGTTIAGRTYALYNFFSENYTTGYNPPPEVDDGVCSYHKAAYPLNICFKPRKKKEIWSAEGLQAMCEVEESFEHKTNLFHDPDCYSHSIGTYVGYMVNKQCMDLNDDDVDDALQILKDCEPYLDDRSLNEDCYETGCPDLPQECTKNNSVYTILHYLSDSKFIDDPDNEISYANIMFDLKNYDDKSVDFYWFHTDKFERTKEVNFIGADERLKFSLFGLYCLLDMCWFIFSCTLVCIAGFIYLRSVIMVVALCADIMLTFIITYFLYNLPMQFPYFPYTNLPGLLIVIAISADAVFLFRDTLVEMKRKYPDEDLALWTSETMRHACLSIFVTSATTACAFYSNYVSDVTTSKLFGMFTGTGMVANFIMMVTLVPAVLVLSHRGIRKKKKAPTATLR